MSDAELWSAWRLWMALAAAIIVVAAILLILIWRTARGIYAEALRALRAAEKIRESTNPIWALETTNEVAATMLETVQQIEKKGGALASALESHAGAH
ncbi:MAG: hypothetical protein M3068_02775 [Gemmatimonadota bacterium]|nr:hypothetical protein [Gemmatimonadota bacterium]